MKKKVKPKKKATKKKVVKSLITKDMNVAKILAKKPEAAEILFKEGLFCIGCPHASSETLEQACKGHGLDVKKILKKLNE
jgi:hydroxylamine reductase